MRPLAKPASPDAPIPPSAEEVDRLATLLLTLPALSAAALPLLKPEHFIDEPHLRALWACAAPLLKAAGAGGIPLDVLERVIAARVGRPSHRARLLRALLLAAPEDVGREAVPGDPSTVIPRPGVLHPAGPGPGSPGSAPEALDLLARFLRERTLRLHAAEWSSTGGAVRLRDLDRALGSLMRRLEAIDDLTRPISCRLDAAIESRRPVRRSPTGAGYFDDFLDGGQADGEAYWLLGDPGAGKSFHAVQVAVAAGRRFHEDALAGGPPRTACIAAYGMRPEDYLRRIWCRGAEVSQRRLLYEFRGPQDLSRRGSLLPYELEMHRARGLPELPDPPGEWERMRAFCQGPGAAVDLLDMTGRDRPCDFTLDELVARLRRIQDQGRMPGLVVVDQAGMANQRRRALKGGPANRRLARALAFADEAVEKIARPFDVPVWLLDGYADPVRRLGPVEALHPALAYEARKRGEGVDAVFCMGPVEQTSKVVRVSCEHSRRTEKAGSRRLAKLHFELGLFRDVTGEYDAVGGRFVPRPGRDPAEAC